MKCCSGTAPNSPVQLDCGEVLFRNAAELSGSAQHELIDGQLVPGGFRGSLGMVFVGALDLPGEFLSVGVTKQNGGSR